MDAATVPTLRPTMSANRMSAVDVSQLDKINAIPNKTTNNVLLDGLCQEDQLYLDALMDDDSSGSDEDLSPASLQGSPWSPAMAERPRMNNKRIKRIKPSYTITMSLEDISYIRPSWGLSKGIVRKLETGKLNAKRTQAKSKPRGASSNGSEPDTRTKVKDEAQELAAPEGSHPSILNTYNLSLVMVILILGSLMLLSYYVDLAREYERTIRIGLELNPRERTLRVLRFKDGQQVANRELRLRYGRGLPANLRHDECTCQMYNVETRKYLPSAVTAKQHLLELDHGKCSACYDWAMRANLQVLVNRSAAADDDSDDLSAHHRDPAAQSSVPTSTRAQEQAPLDEDLSISCYDIRWQSYDSLRTPLVDCIHLNEGDQWFGLGDTHSSPSIWPLNKFQHASQHPKDSTPLVSNLSSEFGGSSDLSGVMQFQSNKLGAHLSMGAMVDLELISSSGFYVGNLRSDFQASVRISAGQREICISVDCTDRCTSVWSRLDHLQGKFKFQNNLLEYSICSASSWKVHVSRLINERLRRSLLSRERYLGGAQQQQNKSTEKSAAPSKQVVASGPSALERIETNEGLQNQRAAPLIASPTQPEALQPPAPVGQPPQVPTKRPFEGIGLVERTIFVTSQEYIPTLDGQTLRQHVDKIVKLNLKTSPILVLDTRWQLYSGSFRINLAYFPKAKLLFEILHNKGFKIVLTVKPYIDATSIGPAALNQLLDNQRLVTTQSGRLGSSLPTEANDISSRYSETPPSNNGSSDADEQPRRSGIYSQQVIRRESFFKFRNQTVFWFNATRARHPPYLFGCKESHEGHCVLLDLTLAHNRQWLVDMIKRSSFLSQEADGILLAGAHPESREWQANYRKAMVELVDRLVYKENYYVIPQWTGNFNYLQLAPRARDWDNLRSLVDSVLTLSMLGFSLVHPGSVWGDLKVAGQKPEVVISKNFRQSGGRLPASPTLNLDDEEDEAQRELRAERELIVRWLQVAVFLPVLQFNDLAPIDKHNLHEQVQHLVRLRKLHIVPELKKNLPYTALLAPPASQSTGVNASSTPASGRPTGIHLRRPAGPVPYQLPALRYTWSTASGTGGGGGQPSSSSHNHYHEPTQEAVGQQFMIGPDTLVAPVLQAGQRQKDIYLPVGMWHDELRQTNIRGGKWLRNYPIELNEIAWFTRARRR